MGSSPDDTPGIFAKSEDLLEILRKGRTFAEELLHENERLRLRIVQLEHGAAEGGDVDELARLRAENAILHERLEAVERRFAEVENVNGDFDRRFVEVERQNEALANLYVASYQLHSTLNHGDVIAAIVEIVTGLVGASEFALFLVDSASRTLHLAAGEDVDERFPVPELAFGQGIEGRVAETGEAFFGEPGSTQEHVACVPLSLMGDCIGVIGIYRMLSQKQGVLTSVDHELLNLLAGQAAAALVSSKLYGLTNEGTNIQGGVPD